MNDSITQFFIALLATLLITGLLSPLARNFQLVDRPDRRKNHLGNIPLVGGLGIYLCLLATLPYFHQLTTSLLSFLIAGGILVAVGVLDDRYGLRVTWRILIEVFAACIMIFGAGLWVGNLGNLVGFGELHMPFWIALPFTLIAVFGILNAMNMIDGVDGAAGGISLIAIGMLLSNTNTSQDLNAIGPLMCGAIAAFLFCNLKLLPFAPKVFLGDAGSKLIGLSLVWFTIDVAESGTGKTGGIEPVTALYVVGLPLFDMVTTTLRRFRKGVSPFTPDRTHIHHIFQRAGLSKTTTTVLILTLAGCINLCGLALNYFEVPEAIQFTVFVALFIVYAYNIGHAFKLSIRLKKSLNTPDPKT
jgi:UDP-GlcNAc:undecaprenyl-phosphate/decaprenyl-phosphate GlcNAc-1-phosphate transferase